MPTLYTIIIDPKISGLLLLVSGGLKKLITPKVIEATIFNTETSIVIDQAHSLPFNKPYTIIMEIKPNIKKITSPLNMDIAPETRVRIAINVNPLGLLSFPFNMLK